MTLTPLGSRVILKPLESIKKTASGFLLTEESAQKPAEATIEAVGDEVERLKVGDKVLYKTYATDEARIGDTDYLVVSEDDILVIVTDDEIV